MSGAASVRWSDLRARALSAVVMLTLGAVEIWLGGWPFAVLVLIVACIGVFFLPGKTTFWACAIIISMCVGPVQSASRSMLARMTPVGLENENFGLYATSGRAVSFLAPFAFTMAIAWGGTQKAGILGIVVVLVLGLATFAVLCRPSRERQAH